MPGSQTAKAAPPPAIESIQIYDRVRLIATVSTEGVTLPESATGTVLANYEAGRAFEVEFTAPFHAVIGIEANLLRRLARE